MKTEYSLLDGVNPVSTIPKYVKEVLHQPALSITDHGTTAGHWAFFKSCKEANLKPLLGMEAYYTMGSRHLKAKDENNKAYYHLILLAQNNTGLKNLYRLSTYANSEGMYYKPRIDDDLIAQYSEGLLATTACLGSATSRLIMSGKHHEAEALIDHHASMFKDRLFVELQAHRDGEQKLVNEVLINMAARKNLPLIITADAHYTHKEDKHFHELTLKMATNYSTSDDGTGDAFSFGDIECHLASHDELASKCQAQNLPYEAISNTVHVANLINSDDYFSDRKNRFPTFKSLPEGVTSWQYLEAVAWAGLLDRVGPSIPDEYVTRFKNEIATLKRANMCDYMLIVWEYTSKAREFGVLVGPGRGSAAGCLIAWCLGITQLDPIQYGLIFERYLNEGRLGTPLIF